MAELARDPSVSAAIEHTLKWDSETVSDMEAVTAIPAPSGAEQRRAEWFAGKMSGLGLEVLPPDEAGNVRARLHGDLPPIVLASHMDTVFNADTDLAGRHEGTRIYMPGISDNGRGLAALIRLAAALQSAKIQTRHTLEFVGTVGEEGAGDLKGVKHLFRSDSDLRASAVAFIAVDGAGIEHIVHRAIGSRRMRIRVTGPGGHSWSDRGSAHPVHALAAAISDAAAAACYPESSFSVGRIEGGTGINVIPSDAYADVDIRSEDSSELARVENAFRSAVASAVDDANRRRRDGTGAIAASFELIGDRPGGVTPADSALVRAALAATFHTGCTPELTSSSTDANVAMSIGIPAISIGAGGHAGAMHTTDEWYDNEGGTRGITRLLLLTLALAQPIAATTV